MIVVAICLILVAAGFSTHLFMEVRPLDTTRDKTSVTTVLCIQMVAQLVPAAIGLALSVASRTEIPISMQALTLAICLPSAVYFARAARKSVHTDGKADYAVILRNVMFSITVLAFSCSALLLGFVALT